MHGHAPPPDPPRHNTTPRSDWRLPKFTPPAIEAGAKRQNGDCLSRPGTSASESHPDRRSESFGISKMMGDSGWTANPGKDQPITSPFRREEGDAPIRHQILLVEDNKADVFLLREAIELAGVLADLHVVTDGERAVGFINVADADDDAPCPSLVILDLNLPKRTVSEVLEHLRRSHKCRHARVLIVTSSDSEQDRTITARLGADIYFRKPSGYDAYMKIGGVVKSMLEAPPSEGGPSAS